MDERGAVRRYLETVQEQIRWKRARPAVSRELEDHLTDQMEALLAEGLEAGEAERRALEDMGDPVALGAELDRVHRPRPQWGALGLTLALAGASAAARLALSGDDPGKVLLALVLGTCAMLGLYLLDVSRLARYAGRVYLAVVALGMLWLRLDLRFFQGNGPFRRRPYALCLFLPAVYALWVYCCRGRGWRGLVLAWAGVFPLEAVCTWLMGGLSNAAVLLFSGTGLMLWAAWREWFGVRRRWGVTAVLAATGALTAWVLWTSRGLCQRLLTAVFPELDPLGQGWLGLRVRQVLGEAALLGPGGMTLTGGKEGIAGPASVVRDFLPAAMTVQWGWLPWLALLGVTGALVVWLLVRGLRQGHQLGSLVVLAVALSLGGRAVLSTVMNLGVVLFSADFPLLAGNTCTVADMALTGLALSVFRGSSIAREEVPPPVRRIRRVRLQVEYR